MKQVLVSNRGIPAPRVEDGAVLVRVKRSCMFGATEMSGVCSSNSADEVSPVLLCGEAK